jgi:UDP-3-O-acyl-N-acetylglucosamine deacetylase
MPENQLINKEEVIRENTGIVLQTTIRQGVSISGVGLHTGASVSLTFHPAEEGHGYRFRRIDLPNR